MTVGAEEAVNIGLTGGIASGKSTVSAQLAELGAAVVDADRIAREIVEPGSPILADIATRFGQALLLPDGSLDRKALGAIVFADEGKRKELESIMHPAIRAIMKQRMTELERDQPTRLVVVDVPLLFESGLAPMFERTLLVYVPPATQLQRLMARDGSTEEEAASRLQSQMPIDRKRELADIIIDNSGSLERTKEQILRFWQGKER